MKRLPLFLLPFALLMGATFVQVKQIKVSPSQGLLVVTSTGQVTQVALPAGVTLNETVNPPVLTLPIATSNPPALVVTHFQTGMANSFPIPEGRTVCVVTRNIPQSLNEDYTIVSNAIVFNPPPNQDDIIQLVCF